MNELQLIRAQTSLERRHLFEVINECADGVRMKPALRRACAEYIVSVGKRWSARLLAHSEQLQRLLAAEGRDGRDERASANDAGFANMDDGGPTSANDAGPVNADDGGLANASDGRVANADDRRRPDVSSPNLAGLRGTGDLRFLLLRAAELARASLEAIENLESILRSPPREGTAPESAYAARRASTSSIRPGELAKTRDDELLVRLAACYSVLSGAPRDIDARLEKLAEQRYSIAHWRTVSSVDADAVLDERARYKAVKERFG